MQICIARTCCRNVFICPSHAGIVSKRLKISSNFFLGFVALPVSCHFRGCKVPLSRIVSGAISSELPFTFTFYYCGFLIPHYGCKILTGRGACHSGGLENFRSYNAEQWQCCMTPRPADTFTPSAYDTVAKHCRYFSYLQMIKRFFHHYFRCLPQNPHYTSSREYFNEL